VTREDIDKPVATFPRVVNRTSEWHMLAYDSEPKVQPIAGVLHCIEVPNEHGAQHNPSIFRRGDDLMVVVRILRNSQTTNVIAKVTADWQLEGSKKMVVNIRDVPGKPAPLRYAAARWLGQQLEDLRVFSWQEGLWAIAAVHDGSHPPRAIRQALLELDDHEIVGVHIQQGVRHEKNWMPCVEGDELRFVHTTDPLVVLQAKRLSNGYGTVPAALSIAQVTGHVRGGSPLIAWDGGWLAIVHQVHRPHRAASDGGLLGFWGPPRDPRPPVIYLHRFAFFDHALTEVVLGEPFYFKHVGIEFCCGLIQAQDGVIASFGVANNEAWLIEISADTIASTVAGTKQIPLEPEDSIEASEIDREAIRTFLEHATPESNGVEINGGINGHGVEVNGVEVNTTEHDSNRKGE
jgi:hypothetical protein